MPLSIRRVVYFDICIWLVVSDSSHRGVRLGESPRVTSGDKGAANDSGSGTLID